jgi:tetratricopeptide (TPR) repeat protein
MSPDYVFPFQDEVIAVLRGAMAANPRDARAPYYLGNLLFDWQPDEAMKLWEKSAALDPKFFLTWRNLAQGYSHQPGDEARAKAIACLEKTVALGDADPTHLVELDQLYEAAAAPVEKRLALLELHQEVVVRKDEGLASLISLKTFAGRPDEAIALLESRTFSIWEGGTRFNTGEAWTDAHLVRGQQRFDAKRYREALADFEDALKFPANLRATDRGNANARQAEISYWIACTRDALGEHDQARQTWKELASTSEAAAGGGRGGGRGGLGNALSARGLQRYYQALALRRLDQNDRVEPIFRELVASSIAALGETTAPAGQSSLGRPTSRTPAATAHYVAGLGYSGLGEKEKAREEFSAALVAAPDLLGAKLALGRL